MSLLVVRHARAGSRRHWDGPDETRPLSGRGRRQAKALVNRSDVGVRALEGLADAARIRASLNRSSLWAGLFDLRENLLGRTLDDLRALAA